MKAINILRRQARLAGIALGCLAMTSLAGAQTTANIGTSISIAKFVAITIPTGPTAFTINVTDGGTAGSYASNSVTFQVASNDAYTVTGGAVNTVLSPYTGPGTLKVSTYTNPSLTSGTSTGTVAITLSGLTFPTAFTASANTSASLTLTVAAS